MNIRQERSGDEEKIRKVHLAAFETATEADLVDALRTSGIELISLVAIENNEIIGHILFSPVTLERDSKVLPSRIIGLAPMAVLPGRQNKGIGTRLVDAGLRACEKADFQIVVVLGHPDYYPRFGFVPAINYGIKSEYDVPAEVFMIKELVPGALNGMSGIIKYHRTFNEL